MLTLMLQKLRMLEMQGVKGDAVVSYCEPLTTQQMRYHRLSRRVNNSANIIPSLDLTICAFVGDARKSIKLFATLALSHSCRIVYATLGLIVVWRTSRRFPLESIPSWRFSRYRARQERGSTNGPSGFSPRDKRAEDSD
jgi:hypothetical protein